jgi:hypothetical protein
MLTDERTSEPNHLDRKPQNQREAASLDVGTLGEIAEREDQTVHDVLMAIDRKRGATSLSTAIHVYIVESLRVALKKTSTA